MPPFNSNQVIDFKRLKCKVFRRKSAHTLAKNAKVYGNPAKPPTTEATKEDPSGFCQLRIQESGDLLVAFFSCHHGWGLAFVVGQFGIGVVFEQ